MLILARFFEKPHRLSGFDLKNANFDGADLYRTRIVNCDCSGALFRGAKVGRMEIKDSVFDGVDFTGITGGGLEDLTFDNCSIRGLKYNDDPPKLDVSNPAFSVSEKSSEISWCCVLERNSQKHRLVMKIKDKLSGEDVDLEFILRRNGDRNTDLIGLIPTKNVKLNDNMLYKKTLYTISNNKHGNLFRNLVFEKLKNWENYAVGGDGDYLDIKIDLTGNSFNEDIIFQPIRSILPGSEFDKDFENCFDGKSGASLVVDYGSENEAVAA
ncbi:MAG: pentapeptide repeat-containing protein [Patescibacteria group bacterium]|nr:pentapeptide repeat-containing protein [Patescibacteria group bacterium]